LGQLIRENLTDARRCKNTQLPLFDLLRQSAYSRRAGYGNKTLINVTHRLLLIVHKPIHCGFGGLES
jgi:hypothetical protein